MVHFLCLAMSESGSNRPDDINRKRPCDEGSSSAVEDPPDVSKKRTRGPNDCLDWEDSDEEYEFTPFTQIPEDVPAASPKAKVFARKSSAKISTGNKPANKSCAKKLSAKKSSAKNVSAKKSCAKNSRSASTDSSAVLKGTFSG